MAFFGRLVSDWVGPAAVRKLSARFKAVTFPGDVITCIGEVIALAEEDGHPVAVLKLLAKNPAGTVTLEGSATVALD